MRHEICVGLPWRSSGYDSVLPVLEAWVRPLVRELLRPDMLQCAVRDQGNLSILPTLVLLPYFSNLIKFLTLYLIIFTP